MSYDCLLIQTAEVVQRLVNSSGAGCYSDRQYPDFDLELDTNVYTADRRYVSVVPAGIKTLEFTSRNTLKCLCSVDIIMRYRFGFGPHDESTGGTEPTSIDDLVQDTERIFMYLCAHRRAGESESFDAWLEDIESRTLTDPKLIRQKQFTSQLRAHYAVTKQIYQPGHN